MIKASTAIVPRPIRRAVAPPGEAPLRRGNESAPDVDPIMRLLQFRQRLDLDRRVANHREQGFVAPDVAFERGHVEVADDQGRLPQFLRPARHPANEVQLLAKFRIDGPIGRVPAGRNVDILQPDSVWQANTDVPRLAIVLPIMAFRLRDLHPADDRDAVVHPLAFQLLVRVSMLAEEVGGEDIIRRLGFLQAENIGPLLLEQPLHDRQPGAYRIDIPGADFQTAHGG